MSRPTREQIDAVPHKAAALLLAAARPDPTLRTAARQVQDALIALDDEVRALRAALAARTPQPAAALDAAHFARQAAFSAETFGPGPRTAGVLDHIRKELAEIEAAPSDLGEWVDVMILAADGAWRAGHGPQEIVDAVIAKQRRNESRTWPDWRTAAPGKAIEHDRSTDAASLPAVPDGEDEPCGSCGHDADHSGGECMWFDDVRTDDGHMQVSCHCDGSPNPDTDPDDPLGEDVPARLAAAADALDAHKYRGLASDLYDAAMELRERGTPEVRAAVAAALARPTGAA